MCRLYHTLNQIRELDRLDLKDFHLRLVTNESLLTPYSC
uniref:Uncharacterized protein n=1 Tax=Myoviridae sp. ctTRu92 TaxID=2825111 RepID=A0A8S5Q6D1_9CAUD|nr:MAG TPA: hypothetical protein [Myoviridae sp. ctTRu92]